MQKPQRRQGSERWRLGLYDPHATWQCCSEPGGMWISESGVLRHCYLLKKGPLATVFHVETGDFSLSRIVDGWYPVNPMLRGESSTWPTLQPMPSQKIRVGGSGRQFKASIASKKIQAQPRCLSLSEVRSLWALRRTFFKVLRDKALGAGKGGCV